MDDVYFVVVGRLTDQQQRVLDFFRGKGPEKFYLRELARELATDPGNLSRVLKELVANGYLDKTKEKKLAYYSQKIVARETRTEAKIADNRELVEYLKGKEGEMAKLVQSLIRIPSVSGSDPEERIAHFIFEKARQFGLFPRVVAVDNRRPNLVVDMSSRNADDKPYFLLVGHMDTVGVGDLENWLYYPFSGHVSGGNVYGRGAADMKGGIVCELMALRAIKDLGLEPAVMPRLLLVSNEEGGSTATGIFEQGMEFLEEEGFVQGTGAIYGYGGSYNVGIGHRGVLRARITTRGRAIHTGSLKWQEKERGVNAVTAMAEILLAYENLELPRTEHPSFPKHGNVITPGTMILHGGTAVSTTPDKCESVVEIRYLPGFDIKEAYAGIKAMGEVVAARRGIELTIEVFVDIPAVCLSPSEKIVETVTAAAESVYGERITARGTGPANESFMLIRKGIPTVVFGPMGAGAHGVNEFVSIASLGKTVRVYLETIANM